LRSDILDETHAAYQPFPPRRHGAETKEKLAYIEAARKAYAWALFEKALVKWTNRYRLIQNA
jgi:hypothetical protein